MTSYKLLIPGKFAWWLSKNGFSEAHLPHLGFDVRLGGMSSSLTLTIPRDRLTETLDLLDRHIADAVAAKDPLQPVKVAPAARTTAQRIHALRARTRLNTP